MADETRRVDVAIVGAGSAGLSALRAARRHTSSVLLIEGGALGTTCARVGCMPSKLLIAAAEAAYDAREAERFGVHVDAVRVDGEAVMARVRRERDRFVGFVVRDTEALGHEHLLRGMARFVDPHTLAVGNTKVVAKAIVVATGSRPQRLPMFDGLGDRLIVNDDVFDWERLPDSVAVFGPGVIGLELGQALHRLGVRVRMFGKGGAVGPLTDPELRATAETIFGAEFPLLPDAAVERVARTPEGAVEVQWRDQGTLQRETFDHVLAATGRTPNLEGLDLEVTGIELERGVPRVDPYTLQTSVPHIFVAGDAGPERALLHEAADEGRIAGHNAGGFPLVTPGVRRSPLSIVFTDPQMCMVGTPYARLMPDALVGEVSYENQGRARVVGKNRGRLRVYADPDTGRFLGAEMVGPAAEHIGHLLAWAHQCELTVARMLDMPFYHPVLEEGLRTALRDLCRQLGDDRCAAYVIGA